MQRTFHRQQQAIEFIRLYRRFDNDIKVLLAYLFNKQLFSYETVSTKQRVFMVLNETEFKWEYENQRYEHSPLQHTYEIILENCPCKLYMDVEVVEDSSFLVVQIRDESREEWNGPSSAAAPLYFVLSLLLLRNLRLDGALLLHFQREQREVQLPCSSEQRRFLLSKQHPFEALYGLGGRFAQGGTAERVFVSFCERR